MLNKKTLFNVVYAIGLVGIFMSCIGFLNEFLTVEQLYGISVTNLATFKGETFWEPFWFYLLCFVISTVAVAVLILWITGVLKRMAWMVNTLLVLACIALLILSFTFAFNARIWDEYNEKWRMGYYSYMNYYTIRSGVMQFVGIMAIILVCHGIDYKMGKKAQIAAKTLEEV